ncbi:Uncharacterised protein [Klebsiella oxytoca]|nr:Uncharacterised protein [Klebsiella oxytoca]SBL27886.1 Uncharacterised protein [Klebsiella oxytoca]SBM09510.1 Uncharacterised protein [Klebsiella oxytoca]
MSITKNYIKNTVCRNNRRDCVFLKYREDGKSRVISENTFTNTNVALNKESDNGNSNQEQ